MKGLHILIPIFLLFLLGCQDESKDSPGERPNILLIMTDDQGYGDIGVHGNPFIRTPVLDSLALLSTRIDPFYVSPVCAPTLQPNWKPWTSTSARFLALPTGIARWVPN